MAGRSGIAAVLVFATLTAAIRGINQVIGKVGIDLLPNPFMAGFCSFGVSFVLLGVAYRWRRGRWPGKLPRPGLVWFCITGLCVALGAGLLYTALLVGTVTVVAPIVATFPVFTLLVAAALGDERITGKVLAGVVLVVVGVAVVSGSAG
ncbi:MAG: EamA family transporter [Chromatiales bacterium]|nr:EamA family transporter [Chromatiales bacterium]